MIAGDCVSPVLARVCGMHGLGYYHVVANWGTGLEAEDPTLTLDRLYLETLPRVAATLEARAAGRRPGADRLPLPGAAAAAASGVRAGPLRRRDGAWVRAPPPLLRYGAGVDFYRRVPSHVTGARGPGCACPRPRRRTRSACWTRTSCRPPPISPRCTPTWSSSRARRRARCSQRDYEIRSAARSAGGGRPVVVAMRRCEPQLRGLRVQSVAVVTPYPEASTSPIRAGLEADSLAVPVAAGLGLTDSLEIAAVPPEAIVRFAVETFRRGPADAVLVACCTFRGFDARDSIAAQLGVPVVTSNHAALGAALRLLDGNDEAPRGAGRVEGAGATLSD